MPNHEEIQINYFCKGFPYKNIFAIASDVKIEASIPTFDLNNINSITDYIIQKYKIS